MFQTLAYMKKQLHSLISGENLSYEEALEAILQIGSGKVNDSQTAAFLMGIQQKGISVEELAGFREGMLSLALDLGFEDIEAMDVCGTGGDGKDTFNISTTSAFVVAGAGVKVAKHGNHGVSSAVGSSTVLEHLGVLFTNDKDFLRKKLEYAGICYLHAPLFHPAMRAVATVRKELGIKTFFNILGPLLNPAKVKSQLTGVSDLGTFGLYQQLFSRQKGNFGVVHALDGYDEISMTGDFRVATKEYDKTYRTEDTTLEKVLESELSGGSTLEESGEILLNILKNEGTKAQSSAVLANAGLAISIAKNIDLEEGIRLAKESLEQGESYKSFLRLIE